MAPHPHHHIRLNESFQSDFWWWLVFCSQWNRVSCWFPPTMVHQVVLSDASGAWGCGAYWHPSWFQLRWSSRSHQPNNSTHQPNNSTQQFDPPTQQSDPTIHLLWGDIAIDDLANPSVICFFLKRFKCDQLKRRT